MASTPASRLPVAAFDASAWLAGWAEHGGIIFLVEDRLYLRRPVLLDPALTGHLDRLCGEMLRAGGGPLIAETLARRREGDVG
jgi:hypothetical protein